MEDQRYPNANANANINASTYRYTYTCGDAHANTDAGQCLHANHHGN